MPAVAPAPPVPPDPVRHLPHRYHPPIERRDATQGALLRTWPRDRVPPEFDGRVLPVDTLVAVRCAELDVPIVAQNATC